MKPPGSAQAGHASEVFPETNPEDHRVRRTAPATLPPPATGGTAIMQTFIMTLECYELVMLRRPPDATPYDDETLERIQAEHLAFHADLRAEGTVVTNGPLIGQPDPSLRGFTFYRVGSVERAREIAEQDPSARAGEARGRRMEWMCPSGTMILPGRPVSPSS